MSNELRLILFDCDGTLVDSVGVIARAMQEAFKTCGLKEPHSDDVRSIIGLSLEEAVSVLHPSGGKAEIFALVEGYRRAHAFHRTSNGVLEPLFEGAKDFVGRLAEDDDKLLGVATGKSRRGLISVLEHYDMLHQFTVLKTADDGPSKPDPGMIVDAMAEAGVKRANTLMIGDTSFDMMMAKAAGVGAIGVTWGYHDREDLRQAGAHFIAESMDHLEEIVQQYFLNESIDDL